MGICKRYYFWFTNSSDRFEGLPDNEEFNTIRGKLDAMKDKYNSSINKFEKSSIGRKYNV